MKAPPVGGDRIITMGGGPILRTTFDKLGGSQRLNLPC